MEGVKIQRLAKFLVANYDTWISTVIQSTPSYYIFDRRMNVLDSC